MPIHTSQTVTITGTVSGGPITEVVRMNGTKLLNVNVTTALAATSINFFEGVPFGNTSAGGGAGSTSSGNSGNLTHNTANFVPIATVASAATGVTNVNIECQNGIFANVSGAAGNVAFTVDFI